MVPDWDRKSALPPSSSGRFPLGLLPSPFLPSRAAVWPSRPLLSHRPLFSPGPLPAQSPLPSPSACCPFFSSLSGRRTAQLLAWPPSSRWAAQLGPVRVARVRGAPCTCSARPLERAGALSLFPASFSVAISSSLSLPPSRFASVRRSQPRRPARVPPRKGERAPSFLSLRTLPESARGPRPFPLPFFSFPPTGRRHRAAAARPLARRPPSPALHHLCPSL
ncbi:hypothetical protein DAI22_11g215701 [Oryza sativa Japonica Group]|nr:hypothetical protein DAI22_11g215701 [Oryza sativa Japonica Group]